MDVLPMTRPNVEVAADTIVSLVAAGLMPGDNLRRAADIAGVPEAAVGAALHRWKARQPVAPPPPNSARVGRPRGFVEFPDSGIRKYATDPEKACAQRVLTVVSQRSGLSVEDLLGKGRATDLVEWRRIAFTAMRDYPMAYPAIAACVGRDHSTVMTGVEAVRSSTRMSIEASRLLRLAKAAE